MDILALVGIVVGAVLAVGSGVATERLKERREARAAARLVWFELLAGYGILFGAVVLDEVPETLRFSDEIWLPCTFRG